MKRDREQKGSVIRKGGFWYVRYADWRIENGERIRKQGLIHKLGPVLKEHLRLRRPPEYIQGIQREFMESVNSTLATPDACSTVSQFVDTVWLAGSVEDQDIYSASSFDNYKYYWRTKLKPFVGDYLLRDLTTAQAENALHEIKRLHPNISKATLHKLRSMLSKVFKRAIGLGLRTGNPIREVAVPKGQSPKRTCAYTLDEIRQMLTLVPHLPTRAIIALAGYCGLSCSEIQGLRWEAYDLDNNEIEVVSSVVRGIRGDPKTEARKDTVPVIKPVRDLLDLYRLQLGNPSSGVMFPSGNGNPIALHNLYYDKIDPILNPCEECGKSKEAHTRSDRRRKDHEYIRRGGLVEWHGWHAFRRGLGSNLYELMPDDDLLIKRILRHANVATTRKSYIKVREPRVVAGMAKLEAEINRAEQVQ
jgi:integrase